jgi:hypothetical protein
MEIGGYVYGVARHFIAFGWFLLAGALGAIAYFVHDFDVLEAWEWWVLAVCGLTIAQFRAYHDLRGQLLQTLMETARVDPAAQRVGFKNALHAARLMGLELERLRLRLRRPRRDRSLPSPEALGRRYREV